MRVIFERVFSQCSVIAFLCSMLLCTTAFADTKKVAWPHYPSVRFSDVWMGDSIGRIRGQYDVMLLIPDLPAGSKAYLHFAQDVETVSSSGRVLESWVAPSVVPMKRWEEYGFFANPQVLLRSKIESRRVVGLRFYFEFVLPNGESRFTGGGSSPGPYYRVLNPDMSVCHDVGAEGLKVCAVVIEPQAF